MVGVIPTEGILGIHNPRCPGDNRRAVGRGQVIMGAMDDALPRPSAPLDESAYTLSIDEAADRYAAAGFPRPTRRLQKYCARGDLDCRKVETTSGEKYLITAESIDRHITYIKETATAAGRAPTRPGASGRGSDLQSDKATKEGAAQPAPARPDVPDFRERYIGHLETENSFLREQNTVLLERVKETNILTGRLQEMLTPLLAPERQAPPASVPHRDTPEQ
jgi:hypothetical protein